MVDGVAKDLNWLNQLAEDDAVRELLQCCGSKRWASQLTQLRPFLSLEQLLENSERIWWTLSAQDWLEAFSAHPKIGEKKAATAGTIQSQEWSENEQAGVKSAREDTLATLAKLNREYEAKFGYIFIVCASGKSSEQMLELLQQRLRHKPEDELSVAATEQALITAIRVRKMLHNL
jgi:OHCU decarboxylase